MQSKLLVIFILGLVVRFGLVALWMTEDFSNFETGDYILYEVGAKHFIAEGDFSNSLFLPRPLLYPVIVALLGTERLVVLFANALAGALLIPVAYLLAQRLGLSETMGQLAALIVALDPSSIVYSAFLGPEPMANVLLALSMIALLITLQSDTSNRYLISALAGGLLAASALIRPATYLFWPVIAIWLLFQYRQHWKSLIIYAVVCAIPIGGWVIHNGIVFNNYTFSTVAGYTMLYYRAASVEHQATGQDIDTVFLNLTRRVEAARGNNPELTDENTRWGYHAASPEITAAINQVSIEVFTAHPLIYLATVPVGFARMYGLVPQVSAFPGAFAWAEALWNIVFTGGAIMGMLLALKRKQWLLFWAVLLICGYFTAGTLLVKSAGMDTRERSMLTIFMACAFAYLIMETRVNRQRTLRPD